MRVLVIARNKHLTPMEALPAMTEGFRAWRDRYRNKMEVFSFFPDSNGGCAVVTTKDEAELHQILLEWPFTPYSEIETLPLVDGDVALRQWSEAVAAMGQPTS